MKNMRLVPEKLTENNFLKDINLFDVYTGDKLAEGKKSYAIEP